MVEDLGPRARSDANGRLLGLEAPRQAGVNVGVEAHADLSRHGARRLLRALRSPGEAGELAEHPVERHRGEGEAEHRRDDQRHDRRRLRVLPLGEGGHQFIPVLAMVMKNRSTTNPPRSQARICARSRWRRRTSSSIFTMRSTGRRRAQRTRQRDRGRRSRKGASRRSFAPAR